MRTGLARIGSGNVGRRFAALLDERRGPLAGEHGHDCPAVVASVRPTELPGDDLLAGLRGPANALVLQTDPLGEMAGISSEAISR